MGMTPAQDKLRQVIEAANTLHIKGILAKEDALRLEELLNESDALKAQITSEGRLGHLNDWAGGGKGIPPMTSGAEIIGIKPAGATKISDGQVGRSRFLELQEAYGEGIFDTSALQKTGENDYRQAFKSYIRGGAERCNYQELKVLQEGADTQGGFLVPADILSRVIAREPTPTRIAARVTQLQTSRDQLLIPKINYSADNLYTTGMRVTWTGEVPASATAHRVTDPVFGQASVSIFTAMMSCPLTNDMIEDANFPIIGYLSGKFGETIDLLRDNMILNGTGVGQPMGVLFNPNATDQPATVISGSGSALTADGIVDLAFALPEQYDDNAAYIFNKTNVAAAIAKLKDTSNRYLWGSGVNDSGLDRGWKNRSLLGYPVILSGFMPNVGAGTYPIIFGDLSGYYLVNRIGFSVQVLRELYAETNQVLVMGRIRFGGACLEPWKLKVQVVSA